MNLPILTFSKVLISNMTIIFFKFWAKSTQVRHFGHRHFVLHETLHFDKFEDADSK